MSSLFELDPLRVAGSGTTTIGIAGEALGNRNLVYLAADGTWQLADADLAATMFVVGLTMSAATTGQRVQILLMGYIGLSTWAWTVGGESGTIYASATSGELTQTIPTPPDKIQIVAIATLSTQILFDPSGGGRGLGEVVEGAFYVVEADATYAWTKRGDTGDVVYGGPDNVGGIAGTDGAVVLQATLDGLTAGRTRKERIAVKGNISSTTELSLDAANNFTILDLRGALIQTGNNRFINITEDMTDFEIIGGIIDGNKGSHASENIGVRNVSNSCTRFVFRDTIYRNFGHSGIFLTGGLINSTIINVKSHDNDFDGIYLDGNVGGAVPTNSVKVVATHCYNNGRHGFNAGFVLNLSYSLCESYNNTNDGWNIEGGTSINDYYFINVVLQACIAHTNRNGFRAQRGGYRVIFQDCISYLNSEDGVTIEGADDAWTIYGAHVDGGYYYENDVFGIYVTLGVKNLKILNLSAFNNSQGGGGDDGIRIANVTNLGDVIINNIHAYDDQGVATQDRGINISANPGGSVVVRNVYGSGNITELFQGVNTITDNIEGFNGQAASTPAVGASPVTFGPYPYAAYIEVVGNVTSVTVRAQISGRPGAAAFEGSWYLYVGDTCVIVYPAAAPTVTLWPL